MRRWLANLRRPKRKLPYSELRTYDAEVEMIDDEGREIPLLFIIHPLSTALPDAIRARPAMQKRSSRPSTGLSS